MLVEAAGARNGFRKRFRRAFESRIDQQCAPRDDLRTRSGASGSPHGSVGRNSRERCEDGADDHSLINGQQTRRVCGETGRAQSRRGAAASKRLFA